jgi:hypothetical protein
MKSQITIDRYGFKHFEVSNEQGGHVSIICFADNGVDIGLISIMNGRGLGGADYVRNLKDTQRHIKHINQIVWLTKEDKDALVEFINDNWTVAA